MTVHEGDLIRHDMIGDRNGLLGIAGVILDAEYDLPAVDAARLVDVLGGEFGPALDLIASYGEGTGHRAGDGDPDILRAS
jgi:hypothetical protein